MDVRKEEDKGGDKKRWIWADTLHALKCHKESHYFAWLQKIIKYIFKFHKKRNLVEIKPFSIQGIFEYSLTLDEVNL